MHEEDTDMVWLALVTVGVLVMLISVLVWAEAASEPEQEGSGR